MAQGNGEAARGHRGAQKSIEVKAGKNSPAIRVHAGPLIGQAHIDVTFLTDCLPTGDEKHVASDHAVSFGGQSCSVLAVRSMPSSKVSNRVVRVFGATV
jgi:hypothetical protein